MTTTLRITKTPTSTTTTTTTPATATATQTRLRRATRSVALAMLHLYQGWSITRTPRCRYTPTCSAYAVEAVELYGAWRGSKLALRRVLRCRPRSGYGYDPVPIGLADPVPIGLAEHDHVSLSRGSNLPTQQQGVRA